MLFSFCFEASLGNQLALFFFIFYPYKRKKMKQKLKIAGLFILIAATLSVVVFCVVNTHKDLSYILGSIIGLIVGIVICTGYHREYLIEFTDDYQVVRKYDILDTKEVNVRFFVERRFYDILMKEDTWHIVSMKQENKEDACEIIANIKKGIPIDKGGMKEVITCK